MRVIGIAPVFACSAVTTGGVPFSVIKADVDKTSRGHFRWFSK